MDFLQALSPLDGRYESKVNELKDYFSEYALIRARIRVEIEWLITLCKHEKMDTLAPLDPQKKVRLRNIYRNLTVQNVLQVKQIEKRTNHDVKAVEYYINECLNKMGMSSLQGIVHFACTSEDINNLSYSLLIKESLENIFLPQWRKIADSIYEKAKEYKDIGMISRTHGQPASPTTMGKEFFNVRYRLNRQLSSLENQPILGKMNGAVGNFNAHIVSFPQVDWKDLSTRFVTSLGLQNNPYTTQIEPHDYMSEIFHNFMRWNTILIDFARDIWGYISLESFQQIPVEGETGSSTMPHKVNPIDFENAEGNLGLANALFDFMAAKLPVSRWQRDLSDSTVLRNIGVAFGHSLLAYKSLLKGLSKIELNREKIRRELDNSWELLAEAVQTVLRKYGIERPYEKLKTLTRGKRIDQDTLISFIRSLELPADIEKELVELTPEKYLGLAKQF